MDRTIVRYLTGMFIALAGCSAGRAEDDSAARLRNLPKGWTVTRSVNIPDEQLPVFSRNLGGQIARGDNTTLSVEGQQIYVNTLVCKTVEDAMKVQATMI